MFYSVHRGRVPGIYDTWDRTKEMVDGYKGAVFKKFSSEYDALFFMENGYENPDKNGHLIPEKSDKSESLIPEKSDKSESLLPEKSDKKSLFPENPEKKYTKSSSGKDPFLLNREDVLKEISFQNISDGIVSFVDGSFSAETNEFGYGAVILLPSGEYHFLKGNGKDTCSMRNVSGEIKAAMASVEWAVSNNKKEILLLYDYMGIEMWAKGLWKCNKEGTKAYRAFMEEASERINISFRKVKAHSGVRFNDLADRLAKEACGII